MGVFDNLFKRNAVQLDNISDSDRYYCEPFIFPHRKGDKPVAPIYMNVITSYIYNGMSNVLFECKTKNVVGEAIISFIDNNMPILLNQYWSLGFIAVRYDKDLNFKVISKDDIKYDNLKRVINRDAVVYYSPLYATKRMSDSKMIIPILEKINAFSNTENYLTETLGCFGILSGQDIPLNPEGKRQMLEGMKNMYGTMKDKYQFMLTNNDMKYTNITPDIKGLELSTKVEEQFKLLCRYFNIPTDLILGNSSFSNVASAKVFFYDTCIRSYAEILLKVARGLLTACGTFVAQKNLNYVITNIPELESTVSGACEEKSACLDLLLKFKEAGVDVEADLNKLYTETIDTLNKV